MCFTFIDFSAEYCMKACAMCMRLKLSGKVDIFVESCLVYGMVRTTCTTSTILNAVLLKKVVLLP